MRRFVLAAAIAGTAILTGCASGPKFAEMSKTIPTLKAGEGRVYFFRADSMLGAAIQPDIRLNNEVVGSSKPGGFFYVDRPAGSFAAAASTETEKTVSFSLDAGETKYVRSSPTFGVLVGRIVLQLEEPAKAQAEVEKLSYVPLKK
ncbi:hypothetical protein ASC95_07495 [Pelomonas sp. Root1217]|nr:DUF2846 domain-containing protein [Pelomonas sp. Root1217]KQV53529.1 hypothetical protein ASC95_07495 [Pelomonas sp. Root1217]